MSHDDPWGAAAGVRTAGRWHFAAAQWGSAMTQALLDAADLQPSSFVLDVAAGSGDPALSIARRLKERIVIAVDNSFSSLLLAKQQANETGLGPKIEFVRADAHQLPLPGSCFDRVICRCGIMFFADVEIALKEILRVLKTGGRAAFLAWGSSEQSFFNLTVGAILRLVPGTTIPEAAQAMFRFARPGSIREALCSAGFRAVEERHVKLLRIWAGSVRELWQHQQEISTLFHPLFRAVPADLRAQVDEAVCAGLARFRSGNVIRTPAELVLASGEKK